MPKIDKELMVLLIYHVKDEDVKKNRTFMLNDKFEKNERNNHVSKMYIQIWSRN